MCNCKCQIETIVFSKNTLSFGTANTSQVSNSCKRNTENSPIRNSEIARLLKTYNQADKKKKCDQDEKY